MKYVFTPALVFLLILSVAEAKDPPSSHQANPPTDQEFQFSTDLLEMMEQGIRFDALQGENEFTLEPPLTFVQSEHLPIPFHGTPSLDFPCLIEVFNPIAPLQTTMESLSNQRIAHDSKQAFHCAPCGYKTELSANFKQHLSTEKHTRNTGPVQKKEVKECKICNYKTEFSHHFKQHLQTFKHLQNMGTRISSGQMKGYCTACNLWLKTERSYNEHLESISHRQKAGELPPPPPKQSEWTCEICNLTFKSKLGFDLHANTIKHRIEAGEPVWKRCEICKTSFDTPNQFKNHLHYADHKKKAGMQRNGLAEAPIPQIPLIEIDSDDDEKAEKKIKVQ